MMSRRKHIFLLRIVQRHQVRVQPASFRVLRTQCFVVAGVKMNHYEMIFVQFLHLLAHHPDFAITQESLPDMAKYAHKPHRHCVPT